MVCSKRATCRKGATSACSTAASCCGIEDRGRRCRDRRADDLHEIRAERAARARLSRCWAGRARDGRRGHAEPRHDRRQHRQRSPAADTPPALLVYDAELELVSARGTRRVPYAEFHTGYKQMDLRPDELIARVRRARARREGARHFYRKVGTRRAQAISKVCFAALAEVEGGVA
jgi:CO/xanthine dehydrogenase FAD-binding subunit